MMELKKNVVTDIYYKQLEGFKKDKIMDDDYFQRNAYLQECIDAHKESLSPEQRLSFEKLLGAFWMMNEYAECRRFGNGLKYMYELGLCLRNNY